MGGLLAHDATRGKGGVPQGSTRDDVGRHLASAYSGHRGWSSFCIGTLDSGGGGGTLKGGGVTVLRCAPRFLRDRGK